MPVEALDRLVGVPVVHHQMDRTWGTQHVVSAGRPGDDPLVLVHGWPQHWLAWRRVIAALAPAHHVVAVDLRGFGWSTQHGPGRPTVAELAADVVAVVDDLGLAPPVLAGHDWGGWIAFRAVLDRPDRFARFSALGIVPPWLDVVSMLRHLGGWAYVLPMAVAGNRIARSPAAVRWLIEHSTSAPIWGDAEHGAALRSYVERVARPESAAMTRHLYATLVRRELPAAWRTRPERLRVPTAVVLGEHETIARPTMFWDRSHPGELRVATVGGARHWLAEEQPDAVIEHLRRQLLRAA